MEYSDAEAGRGAERSHELRDVSCVRLEREVLGVRLCRQHCDNMGGCLEQAGREAVREAVCEAERSHETRQISCVRLERELFGVRL